MVGLQEGLAQCLAGAGVVCVTDGLTGWVSQGLSSAWMVGVSFPGAAVTNDHKLGALKQQKCILSLL